MIVMASQQATSPDFNSPQHTQNVCPFGSKYHSEDAVDSWRENNCDHSYFLHRKETYRARCSAKRQHLQSVIFHQEHITRFENGKPEFSASEDSANLLDAYVQFHVP
jgi:hypothetical protein